MRFTLKKVKILLIGLLAVVIMFVGLLHSALIQQRIIDWLSQRANERVGVTFKLTRYQWTPFARIIIDDLVIDHAGQEILNCKRAEISFRLKLKCPYFEITSLLLQQARFHVEMDEKGRWSVPIGRAPTLLKGDENDSCWSEFTLPAIRVEDANIYVMRKDHSVFTVERVDAILSLEVIRSSGHFTVKVHLGSKPEGEGHGWRLFQW